MTKKEFLEQIAAELFPTKTPEKEYWCFIYRFDYDNINLLSDTDKNSTCIAQLIEDKCNYKPSNISTIISSIINKIQNCFRGCLKSNFGYLKTSLVPK